MANLTETPLKALYESDEIAWLEAMSRLAAERRFAEFDCEHPSEFLNDMAISERRQVVSRMAVLLMHPLKWAYQPEQRSESWRITVFTQQGELQDRLENRTLRNHADESLAVAYAQARKRGARETRPPISTFPADCPWTVDDLIDEDKDLLA